MLVVGVGCQLCVFDCFGGLGITVAAFPVPPKLLGARALEELTVPSSRLLIVLELAEGIV